MGNALGCVLIRFTQRRVNVSLSSKEIAAVSGSAFCRNLAVLFGRVSNAVTLYFDALTSLPHVS
jgi:hypothetical protein